MSDIPKVLIVDDDPRMCDSLQALLSNQDYELKTHNSVKEAIECLDNNVFDLTLLDIVMGNENGFTVMDHIINQNLDTLAVIITGNASTETAVEALRKGAYDYLRKPFEAEELLKTVENALDHKRLKSEFKHANEALQKTKKELETIADSVPASIFYKDKNNVMLRVNKTYAKMIGISKEDIEGKSGFDLTANRELAETYWRDDKEVIASGTPKRNIIEPLISDETRWVQTDKIPYIDDKGNIIGVIGFSIDITSRMKAEEALRKNEEKLRIITDTALDSIFCKDINRRYTFVNPSMLQLLNCTKADLIGKVSEEVFDKEDAAIVTEVDERTLNGENVSEVRSLFIAGKPYTFHTIQVPQRDSGGNITGISGIVRDITGFVQAQEALRESEHYLKEAQAIVKLGHWKLDTETEEVSGSDEFFHIFDLTRQEATLKAFADVVHPDDREYDLYHIKRGMEEGTPWDIEHRLILKDGTEKTVHAKGSPIIDKTGKVIEIVGTIQDISEKKRLEAQLQQAQKMEAIGTLAGGIAHQFNNALSPIIANVDMLELDFPDEEKITAYTKQMKDPARRMVLLTDQLLAYARGGKYQVRILSLSDSVRDTLPLIRHTIDPSIYVETNLPRDIFSIEADLTQIQTVLSAVLTNASEAIEGKGRIRITCRNETITDETATDFPGFKPGDYVRLMIEDDGKGMDEETRSLIFEPFFTTKFKGRGLGMAAAYGIIKNHDGWILVDSELGKGTTVHIYLPAVGTPVKESEKPKIEPILIKGTGTILVIEDEEMVMEVITALLERLGYRVLGAKTGKKAIDIAKTFDGDIDLAILDIILPDMGGKAIYPYIMEARPNLKVIVCSGYSADGPPQEVLDAGAQDFIQKPFTVTEISKKLKTVLEGG